MASYFPTTIEDGKYVLRLDWKEMKLVETAVKQTLAHRQKAREYYNPKRKQTENIINQNPIEPPIQAPRPRLVLNVVSS